MLGFGGELGVVGDDRVLEEALGGVSSVIDRLRAEMWLRVMQTRNAIHGARDDLLVCRRISQAALGLREWIVEWSATYRRLCSAACSHLRETDVGAA